MTHCPVSLGCCFEFSMRWDWLFPLIPALNDRNLFFVNKYRERTEKGYPPEFKEEAVKLITEQEAKCLPKKEDTYGGHMN